MDGYETSTPGAGTRQRRLRAHIDGRLSRLPFHGHTAMKWDCREGFSDYIFGARAGPTVHVTNVLHELAHAVEFGAANFKRRCRAGRFVFKARTEMVAGRAVCEPQTGQMTMREARVFGIQLRLMEACGLKADKKAYIDECTRIASHLPDWFAFGRMRKAVISREVRRSYAAWPVNAVLRELEAWLDAMARRVRSH